jgi:hypothetical protein
MPHNLGFCHTFWRVLSAIASVGCFVALADAQIGQPDRLLVGSMSLASFGAISANIPLPAFPNQKFCSVVTLGPNTVVWAYVPTNAERSGNFSAFAGQLLDPSSNQPFPGGVIPASLLPAVFAWRLAPVGPAPGEVCLNTFPGGSVQFSTVSYITGSAPGDAIFVTANTATLSYTLGSMPPSVPISIGSFSMSPLTFTTSVSSAPPATLLTSRFNLPPIPNLSIQATPCCTTPSTLNVGVRAANLVPGTYRSNVSVIPINTTQVPQTIEVDLTITAPPTWVTTSANVVTFEPYTLGGTSLPGAQIINLSSLGAAQSFTITSGSTTPPGVNWFSVTPTRGTSPGQLTITLNVAVLNKLGRGEFTGFFDINAPGAPNSPLRVMVFLSVFPNADFTVDPAALTFTYNLGDPTPAPQPIGLDPVQSPQGSLMGLSFSPLLTMANAQDPDWVNVAPNMTGLPGTLNVSLDSNLINQLSAGDHIAYLNVNSAVANSGVDPANSNTAQPIMITLTVTGTPAATTTTQVLAQIADGSGWQTKIVLVNTDLNNTASFTLHFWPGQSTPATLAPVLTTGPLTNFILTDTIPAGGSRTYLTQGSNSGPLWQGWGELIAPPSVGGTAVFRQSTGADQDIEGAVPLKPADGALFVLSFDCSSPDSAHSFTTSMALINASADQAANIAVMAYDTSGTPIALPSSSATLNMPPRGHAAFSLVDPNYFPSLLGQRGTLVFSTSTGQIAGLGLRFSSREAFTSIGTLTPATGGQTKHIAQIADGSMWQSSIVIVNLDTIPAAITIHFNPSSLTPNASLALVNPGLVGSVFTTQTPIPPNGSLWIDTQGNSAQLWEGWAEVTSNANINGFAIFRHVFSGSGDSEGAVPFTTPGGTRFLIPFDNTNGFVTSLAMVSPDSTQVQVTGTFRDPSGQPVMLLSGSNSLFLTGHIAFALTDPTPFDVPGSGVADFTTTGTELFGIGLLFNPTNSFTSLPILKK